MKFTIEEVIDHLRWLYEESGSLPTLTHDDLVHLFAGVLTSIQDSHCTACDVDTSAIGEYYMVHNNLWKRYGCGRGMLCIGCLEERMGRELTGDDFIDALINDPTKDSISDRLKSRLAALH